MITALSFFFGGLIRRWWGGWFSPNSLVKRLVVPAIAFGLTFWACGDWQQSLFSAVAVLLLFLNTFHGEGMNYEAQPIWKNVLIMGGSYGLTALALCLGWGWYISDWSYAFHAIPLFFSPVGYVAAFKLWPSGRSFGEYPVGNVFIDGYAAIGELWLGGLIYTALC